MYKREIPFEIIIALSCDNASVMTGNVSSFKTKLEEYCHNKVLILPCPCHSVALAVHAACAKLPPDVEDMLQKIPNFINNSPKRTEIFKQFQNSFEASSHKILKFCGTRWLSRDTCVNRILENWNLLLLFFQQIFVNEKSKTAGHLLQKMQNPDIKAYFYILQYILHIFNSFNTSFQTVQTRIHLLQPMSLQLLCNILQNFLKPSLLKRMDLIRTIDFALSIYHKDFNEIYLGLKCECYLKDLQCENEVEIVKTIKNKYLEFYVNAAEKIRNRLPIDDKFLSKLNVFEPEVALFDSCRDVSFDNVQFIAKKIGGFDESELKKEWASLHLDFTLEHKQNLSVCSFDQMWKTILITENKQGNFKYPNLQKLLAAVRSLPNSNAGYERSFSTLTDVKTNKRNKLSDTNVSSFCVVKSGLKAKGETSQTMQINASHLSLMSSRNLYKKSKQQKQNFKLNLFSDKSDI